MKQITAIGALIILAALTTSAQAVCNDCVLQVTPVDATLCQGDPVAIDITITNVYAYERTLDLTFKSDLQMASDMPGRVTVGAYGTKSFRAEFTPSVQKLGEHRMTFTASGNGASDSDDALFTISNCFSTDVGMSSGSAGGIELCEGSEGRVDLTVANNGQKEDNYAVYVSKVPDSLKVTFLGGTFALAPGGSRVVSINVEAVGSEYGDYELEAHVGSSAGSFTKPFKVRLSNCYHTSVTAPEAFPTCGDAGIAYEAVVKNGGCVDNTYDIDIKTDGGCVAASAVKTLQLRAGESKPVVVNIRPFTGECRVTVSALSKYDSDSASTLVSSSACYGVDVEIAPGNISACRGEPVQYEVSIRNTGFYADTYKLQIAGINAALPKSLFYLKAGESDKVTFNVSGTWCVPGTGMKFSATATGRSSDTDRAELRFLEAGEQCAALELIPGQDPLPISCEGDSYTFYVTNTGFTMQNVTIEVRGPEQYTVQPSAMRLQPYESRPVAVYFFGREGMNAAGGTTDMPARILIIAKSEYKSAYLELDVDLMAPQCMISRPVSPIAPDNGADGGGSADNGADGGGSANGGGNSNPGGIAPSGGTVSAKGSGLMMLLSALAVLACVLLILFLVVRSRPSKKKAVPKEVFPEVRAPAPQREAFAYSAPAYRQAQTGADELRASQIRRLEAIKEAVSRSTIQ